MAFRRKMGRRKSRRLFTRTARGSNSMNRKHPMRGGIRF